ncbi:MAG TPA: aldehyde ferredoxin oxidoreductase family protein, partial [Anaerolineae bacterium]|nr:aldehyde ferredoxin oxidoreductase family protein [Anaerolineae bacterium]
MPYSYVGRLIRLDLGDGHWRVEAIDDALVKKYLLGGGLAAKIFYEEMEPSRDALHPQSSLIWMIGVLSGTVLPTSCRLCLCGRSPLTGIWNEATVGGYWAAQLRAASYDGLVIIGRAQEPVYVWIADDTVEVRPAAHLWGLDTIQAAAAIREETDSQAQVACIGPAGEKLSRIASVMIGGTDARAAGRGGMGALMGSKNLKAVAVRGSSKPDYYDREGLLSSVREANAAIRENSLGMTQFGTSGGIITTEKVGDMAIQNWRLGSWEEGAPKITGERMAETILTGNYRCHACPIGCGREIEIREGPFAGLQGSGPEYETVIGFGPMCLNDDLESIVAMNDLCNRYGLDTISTSGTVAFAMEAWEKGLLDSQDTGGLDLSWGHTESMMRLIEMIAQREGLGDVLADGTRAAAERLNANSIEFAVQVKGMELPYHDPRAFTSMALGYATANRGGDHLETMTYWHEYGKQWPDMGYVDPPDKLSSEGKARMVYDFQNLMQVFNGLGLCKFIAKAGVGPQLLAEWANLALGWEWDVEDVL